MKIPLDGDRKRTVKLFILIYKSAARILQPSKMFKIFLEEATYLRIGKITVAVWGYRLQTKLYPPSIFQKKNL
jgi:hypothetical protein